MNNNLSVISRQRKSIYMVDTRARSAPCLCVFSGRIGRIRTLNEVHSMANGSLYGRKNTVVKKKNLFFFSLVRKTRKHDAAATRPLSPCSLFTMLFCFGDPTRRRVERGRRARRVWTIRAAAVGAARRRNLLGRNYFKSGPGRAIGKRRASASTDGRRRSRERRTVSRSTRNRTHAPVDNQPLQPTASLLIINIGV